MTDKKKGEVERMGESVGGSIKQGWDAAKKFGKGVIDGVSEKKK